MSLAKSILASIILSFLVISFNTADGQIKIYSSESVRVIGGTAGDFENSNKEERGWNRVDAPGPGEKMWEDEQAMEQERPGQQREQARQEQREKKKGRKKRVECFTIPDHGAIFRMCKDKQGKTVSMEEVGCVKKRLR